MGSVISTGRVLLPQSWLSTAGLFALAAATGVGYLFFRALYALTLDPLASVPGPRLCVVSRFPYWIQVFRGRDIHWIHALHQRYGPVVRYGPGDLSFSSPQAWRDVHGHVKGRPTQPKADDYGMQPANGVRSILACDDSSHARVRRIFTPAFSDRALRQQEPIFKNYAELLVDKVQQAVHRSRSPVQLEVTRYLNFVSFDVMAELCFGHPLGLLEKDEFSPWVSSIFELIGLLPVSMFVEYYPVLSGLLKKFEPKWVRDTKDGHFKHSADRVDQRLREGTDRPDFWNLVVSKDEAEGGGLSRGEMHSNAEVFMMAGTETTATLLSGLLFQLGSDPRKLRLLAQEIRDNFRSIEDMTFDTLSKLPYLRACIKEGLRIYPPVPSGAPRVAQDGGLTIENKWVPAGTRLLLTQYAAHRSAANFAEPSIFAPERWLPKDHAESDKTGRFIDDNAEAYLPFGLGARACIGKNMALHESRLLLAALLLRFDFELADESRGWMDQKAHALWVKQPLMCHVSLA